MHKKDEKDTDSDDVSTEEDSDSQMEVDEEDVHKKELENAWILGIKPKSKTKNSNNS